MTESEAKKEIEHNVFCNTDNYEMTISKECYKTIINALEKQIPKKPDCIEDKMWCCPVCDNHLLPKWIKYPTELMPKTEGLPHCMSCGQKIDWSE
jgi:hypothetical protein